MPCTVFFGSAFNLPLPCVLYHTSFLYSVPYTVTVFPALVSVTCSPLLCSLYKYMCSSLTLPVCSRYPVCTKQLVLFLDLVWAHPLWTNILDMTLACLGPVSFNFNKLSYLIEPLYLPHLHLGPNSGLRCFGTGAVTQIEYLKQVEDKINSWFYGGRLKSAAREVCLASNYVTTAIMSAPQAFCHHRLHLTSRRIMRITSSC